MRDVGANYLAAFFGMTDIHFTMKSEPFYRVNGKMVMVGQRFRQLVAYAGEKSLKGDSFEQNGEAHIAERFLGHRGRGERPPRLLRNGR